MKPHHKTALFAIVIALFTLAFAQSVRAQTSDAATILAAAKAASGGDAWNAIETLTTKATLAQGGITGTYEEWDDVQTGRNAAFYSLGPGTGGQGYDGKDAWNQDQTGQSRVVADADSRQSAITNAYLVSLSYWFPDRIPGTVAFARHVRENNREFDVLAVAPVGGYPFELWIDSATRLIDRTVEPMAEQTQTTVFSDYRLVSGVMLPFANRQSTGQARYDQTTTVQRIDANPTIPASRYALPPPPAPDFAFDNGKTSTTVPFHYLGSHLYYDLTINGQKFSAVFDSGGAYVLSSVVAKGLGVRPQGAAQGGGSGEGSVDVAMARVNEVRFGALRMIHPLFFVMSIPFLKQNPIVGYELFNRFVVRIDYDTHTLTFTRPDRFRYTGAGTVVPFRFNDRTPEVDGVVDGLPGVFTIDTGSGSSLDLSAPFVAQHRLREKYHAAVTTISGYGVGGPEHSAMARIHTLTIGPGVTAHELATGLSLDTAGSGANKVLAGNIGEGFLHRFNLIFDYSRQQIIFEKNSYYGEADPWNRSGLTLYAGDGSGLVVAVVPGGPAAQAGIKVGDTLLTIDGHPVSKLAFGGASNLFKQSVGTHVQVRLLSNKRPRTVMIVLRDLV